MRVTNLVQAGVLAVSGVSGAIIVPRDTTTTTLLLPTTTVATTTSISSTTTTQDVETSVPSPLAPLNSTLPPQAPLAALQAWCPSEIFCNGPLLQTINLAQLYGDSKTFVDKPTVGTSNTTINDFFALYNVSTAGNYSDVTIGALETFVDTDFQGEGLELEQTILPSNSTPTFLQPNSTGIVSPIILGWANIVNSYWASLVRVTNSSTLCDGVSCESTLIPLNHTFVVPGGRFREQYYWDSYWIIEGLLQSELFDIANSSLQNFMDELEKYGFIPNGGRIYYLNRSQPPLFMKMLYAYVNATNDVSILERALPLAEVELDWWHTNRTVNITSPYSNNTWEVAHYAVVNTAPRPEGFLEDYLTANGADIEVPYTEDQKAALYAELASGAESGHDYTARFATNPYLGNITDQNPLLRTLNVRATIPVDLNSILYKYRSLLAELYTLAASNSTLAPPTLATTPGNSTYFHQRAAYHTSVAATLKSAILDLFWEPSTLAFYDFNTTANARSTWFSPAAFYPYWSGIVPDEVATNATNAQAAFASVRFVFSRYNGTFPASFVQTGLQWDAPNAWPPHQFILLEALRNLPANITSGSLPTLSANVSSFSLVPTGQLGLTEDALPLQPLESGANSSSTGAAADINVLEDGLTVFNGGESTPGEGWGEALQREVANRYMSSVFCSWYSTGGSIPGLLNRLPDDTLNLTFSLNSTGRMFEKESLFDIDVAGSGGEYVVQAGFGWTNGIALWIASQYGPVLSTPSCPTIDANSTISTSIVYRRNLAKIPRRGAFSLRDTLRRKMGTTEGGRRAVSRKSLAGRLGAWAYAKVRTSAN